MGYNEAPLYEKANRNLEFERPKVYKTALYPSPILMWHEQEVRKRAKGKYNEIDGNYMKAALCGVINQWSAIIQDHKKLIEDFFMYLDTERKNYSKAKEIWIEINRLKENKKNDTKKSIELLARTNLQPYIPIRDEPGVQGATINASG
jgi:hypothetical protein